MHSEVWEIVCTKTLMMLITVWVLAELISFSTTVLFFVSFGIIKLVLHASAVC